MEMEQKTKKVNKPMFWAGLGPILISAGSLLFVQKDLGLWPMLTGIFGIVSIGASKYRPMK